MNIQLITLEVLYKTGTSIILTPENETVGPLVLPDLRIMGHRYFSITLRDRAYFLFTRATSKVTSARNRTISYRACANFAIQNVTSFFRAMRHFLLFGGNSLLLLFCRKAIVQTTISTTPTSSNNRKKI